MGIFSTFPFGILKTIINSGSDLLGSLQKFGVKVCPECKTQWNESVNSPVQEKCGHIKCRQCLIRSLIAVKRDSCPQCIPACPECEVEWNDLSCSPIQEKCGHIKCRKCFVKSLLSIYHSCVQCDSDSTDEESSQSSSSNSNELLYQSPAKVNKGFKAPVFSLTSPERVKKLQYISPSSNRRASVVGSISSDRVNNASPEEGNQRRRSTGNSFTPVNAFEKRWEKKIEETSFRRKLWQKQKQRNNRSGGLHHHRTQQQHYKGKWSTLRTTESSRNKNNKTSITLNQVIKIEPGTSTATTDRHSPSFDKNAGQIPDHINVINAGPRNSLFECTQCKKKFKTKAHISYHQYCSSPGSKKPFKCDICDREFIVQSHFKYHMMTHGKEKPFKCDQCGKGHAKKLDLDRHMRFHAMDRSFQCNICGRAFHTQVILTNHMFTHNDREFQCRHCDKKFARLITLNKHELVHTTGEKPYKCRECESSFSRKDGLERHVLHIHKLNTRTMPRYAFLYQKVVKPKPPVDGAKVQKKKKPGTNKVKVKTEVDANGITDSNPSEFDSESKSSSREGTMATYTHMDPASAPSAHHGWVKVHPTQNYGNNGTSSGYPIPGPGSFDTINQNDFAELKLQSPFPPRPHICPMCGASFVHKEDVDWHVRIMHNDPESSSHSVSSSPMKQPQGGNLRDSVRANIMGLLDDGSDTHSQSNPYHVARTVSNEFLPHNTSTAFSTSHALNSAVRVQHEYKSEYNVASSAVSATNAGHHGYTSPTSYPESEFLVPGAGTVSSSSMVSTGFISPQYLQPACIINGYVLPPASQVATSSSGPVCVVASETEKFDDLITLSSSFMFNNYDSAPTSAIASTGSHNNGTAHASSSTSFGGIIPPPTSVSTSNVNCGNAAPTVTPLEPQFTICQTQDSGNTRIYTDLCSAYPET